jgi:[ribosomal protein S5]-alanine N-acetyltransferase
VIPVPDPPLVWGDPVLTLRPWGLEDASALVAAWADPEIQRWTDVPEPRDLPAARRWIAGDEVRRRRWLSLDLVVECDGQVAGEVGLASFDRGSGTAEAGWWTASGARGRGVASGAATVLVAWALSELGLTRLVARCPSGNPASVAVARRAGFEVVAEDGGAVVLQAT